jgi:predicted amidophosphoribosyltransferase
MLEALIDFVFPARCIVCDRKPKQHCEECRLEPRIIAVEGFGFPVFTALELEGASEKVISGYKDQHLTALEKPLAKVAAKLLSRQDFSGVDAVVTPARNARNYRKRGFDPAHNIAKRALRFADLPIPVLRLANSRSRLDQRGLNKAQRAENVHQAMTLKRMGLIRVALFDDVITSGATIQEMARACEQAGATVAFCCVLAQRNSVN